MENTTTLSSHLALVDFPLFSRFSSVSATSRPAPVRTGEENSLDRLPFPVSFLVSSGLLGLGATSEEPLSPRRKSTWR